MTQSMFDDEFYETDDDAAYAAFDALAEDFDAAEERSMFEREDRLATELERLEQHLDNLEAERNARAFTSQMHVLRSHVDQRFDAIAIRAGVEISPAQRASVLAVAQSMTGPGEAPDLDAAFEAIRSIGTAAPSSAAPNQSAAAADRPAKRSVDDIDFSDREQRIQLMVENMERAAAARDKAPASSEAPAASDPDLAA
jgi:hypothetical protein